jgi:hypothetical protein
MLDAPGFHALWPTPLGLHRWPLAAEHNPLLVRVLSALRATLTAQATVSADTPTRTPTGNRVDGRADESPFWVSPDDLHRRIQMPQWQALVQFIVQSLNATVARANAAAWPAEHAREGLPLALRIDGMWCQYSQRGAFHDVHTHGNCSWSGVYVLQADPDERRVQHSTWGAANGVTRLYGPPFTHLGGAHMDWGNAYLLPPHVDVPPLPGQLLIFPSWLAHQALPYEGEQPRVIVSFNASVMHADGRSVAPHAYAPR